MSGLVHQFQVSCSLRDTTRGLLEGPRSTNRRFSFGKWREMALKCSHIASNPGEEGLGLRLAVS